MPNASNKDFAKVGSDDLLVGETYTVTFVDDAGTSLSSGST